MDKKNLICLTLVSKHFYIPVPFALVTIINLSEFTGTKLFGSQHMHKKTEDMCSVVQETVKKTYT
jgi:hypothetical protein